MKRTRLEGTRSQLAGMAFSLVLAWSSPVAAIVPNDALSHERFWMALGIQAGLCCWMRPSLRNWFWAC